jgi:hypothetical protein
MSSDFRDEAPTDRWPPSFEEWPRDQQISEITLRMKRRGLVADILSHAGVDRDQYSLADDEKLTKEELAAIYLTLEGISSDSN